MSELYDTLKKILATFLGDVEEATDADIERAESRLGRKLPPPLRQFYRLASRSRLLMDSYNHFIPLEEIEVVDGRLVFCRENQLNYAWGVPIENDSTTDDGDVDVKHRAESEWHLDCSSLKEFLTQMTCWQLVNALPASARFEYQRRVRDVLPPGFIDVTKGIAPSMRTFVDFEKQVVIVALLEQRIGYVGGKSDDVLEAFEDSSGVDLDWL